MSANTKADNLAQFFEAIHSNQVANIKQFAQPYSLILRVNDCLVRAGQNLIDPKPLMAGNLFLRCQYAYKAASGMALSGQVVEAFAMMRLCLEYAGYALAIFADQNLEAIFLKRNVSAADMVVQKEKFKISHIRKTISDFDSKLADNFQLFYERAIDFGGHPNPHATLSAVKLETSGTDSFLHTLALSTEPKALLHAMKSTAQIGLTALFIFQHIFKAKFELLGIRAEMDALRKENL